MVAGYRMVVRKVLTHLKELQFRGILLHLPNMDVVLPTLRAPEMKGTKLW